MDKLLKVSLLSLDRILGILLHPNPHKHSVTSHQQFTVLILLLYTCVPECKEALQEQIILAIAQMNLYLSHTAPLTDHIALHSLVAHASESTLLLIIIAEVTNLFI